MRGHTPAQPVDYRKYVHETSKKNEGPETFASGRSFCPGFVSLTAENRASPRASSADAMTDAAQQVSDGISFSASTAAEHGEALPRKRGNGRIRPHRPSSNFPSLHIVD